MLAMLHPPAEFVCVSAHVRARVGCLHFLVVGHCVFIRPGACVRAELRAYGLSTLLCGRGMAGFSESVTGPHEGLVAV